MKAYVAYHPKTGAIVTLNVPYITDDAKPELSAAAQGFLDHEVGNVLFTNQKVVVNAAAPGQFLTCLADLQNVPGETVPAIFPNRICNG